MIAARLVPLKKAVTVLPMGIFMGIAVIVMVSLKWMPAVYFVLILIGALAGYFVVPMNALLQHRGHVLMSAGHSIAVQNFNENVSILVMLALYSLMIRFDMRIQSIVVLFGLFISAAMYLVMRWNAANHRADPHLDRLIGEVTGVPRRRAVVSADRHQVRRHAAVVARQAVLGCCNRSLRALVLGDHLRAEQQQDRRELEAQQHHDGGGERAVDDSPATASRSTTRARGA